MFWLLAMITTALATPRCDLVTMSDVMAVTPPAVIVLGETHGTQPDLKRASQIVNRLAKRAPVTLALEPVYAQRQAALDRYASGDITVEALPGAVGWDETFGFPLSPYRGLLTAADKGVKVVGVGLARQAAPDEAEFPVPGGYMSILRDAMAGAEMPLSLQSRFVRTMAYRDFRMAEAALAGWNGRGYLVVLVGREHVEGGKGVSWQAGLMSQAPVHSYILSYGGEPGCYRGDQIWREGLWEKLR